jgi:AraC-like DNA-binding protein
MTKEKPLAPDAEVKADALSRKTLVQMLQTQLVPRIEQGSAALVVAYPPMPVSQARITPRTAPLLKTKGRKSETVLSSHWDEEGFNSARYPILIWVTEGEADFRIGVTRRMAAQNKKLSPRHGYYVVNLLQGSLFVVPPEIPISDATRPHWERPRLEEAHSQLLWFHILPAGVSLHICSTSGAEHISTRSLFISEPRLLPLAEFLIRELQTPATRSDELARHYLLALLLHIERILQESRAPQDEDFTAPPAQHLVNTASTPLQRACDFIEAHFSQKISNNEIAAHAYVSTTQLNRLFRAELKTTPARYLAERRLDQSCSLLTTTDLPIKRIAVLCGYRNPEYFNRAFAQRHGVSPGEFRRRNPA